MNNKFRMVCSDLSLFEYQKDLPKEYYFRNYKIGEQERWAEIVTSAGEFKTTVEALKRFESEFIIDEESFSIRTIFLMENNSDLPIGTATAWFDINNSEIGRLHWVSIKKEFQGRGLARPLIYRAIELLKKYHKSAYLITQDSSWKAIKIYEDCGFLRNKL